MRLTDNAEQDFNELQLSISEIAKRITILKRSLKNESENILKKDIEINDIYQKASELEKEINVITEINADLQKVSDSLTTEIKDTKNVIDKVITTFCIAKY
jgi:chromosome segregation ATPase